MKKIWENHAIISILRPITLKSWSYSADVVSNESLFFNIINPTQLPTIE